MVRAVIPQYRHARKPGRFTYVVNVLIHLPKVEPRGFEPRTSAVQGRRSPRLSYGPLFPPSTTSRFHGWARLDSNQGPRPYQGRALTD